MNGDLKDLHALVLRAAATAYLLEAKLPSGATRDRVETCTRKLQQLRDGLEDEIKQLEKYERVEGPR